jgi:hypothetical protein
MNELEKVKVSYANGELESLRIQLEAFISSNKEKILQFKMQEEQTWKRPLDLATAMKLFILKVRTIDIEAEMQDQIKAINKEFEMNYAAEAEENTRCLEWIRHNGHTWRDFRVLAIIYVFDQNEYHMLSRFAS